MLFDQGMSTGEWSGPQRNGEHSLKRKADMKTLWWGLFLKDGRELVFSNFGLILESSIAIFFLTALQRTSP